MIVWYSTRNSVERGQISALAIIEVLAAISFYWYIAVRFETQIHLWLSVAIAPLLLLRSPASAKQGVSWFSSYVDRSFSDVLNKKVNPYLSIPFFLSVFIAMITAISISSIASRTFFFSDHPYFAIVHGAFVGLISTQVALAITVAFAAREVIAIARKRLPGVIVAAMLPIAVGFGAWFGEMQIIAILCASIVAGFLSSIAANMAAIIMSSALAKTFESKDASLGGSDIVRAVLAEAPYYFSLFVPGFLLGIWFRTIGIRFLATALHLRDGRKSLAENYRRTLLILDFCTLPEIVPGYQRADPFNLSYFLSRRNRYTNIFGRYLYLACFLILFCPAYVYRMSIKSTAWAYWVAVYIAQLPNRAQDPKLLSSLLSNEKEKARLIFAVFTIFMLFVVNVNWWDFFADKLPGAVILPIEIVFAIEFSAFKPWQWLYLAISLLTLLIFFLNADLRVYAHHRQPVAAVLAERIEILRRLRNILTWALLLLIFVYALLRLGIPEKLVSEQVYQKLYFIYGSALP